MKGCLYVKILVTIYFCFYVGWYSVENECRVSMHQENTHSLEQVLDLLVSLLAIVAGQLPGKPGDQTGSVLVSAPQDLHHYWKELDNLPVTVLEVLGHLVTMPPGSCTPNLFCCSLHHLSL